MTLLDVTFTDEYGQLQHVEVSQALGGGGSYQVMVNMYYTGKIINYHLIGWTSDVRTPVLCGDDIGVILELIKEW